MEINVNTMLEQNYEKEITSFEENKSTGIENTQIDTTSDIGMNGIYEIIAAYSMIHDKPMEKVKTKRIGEIIIIENKKVFFDYITFSINDNYDGFTKYFPDNRIDYSRLHTLYIGMNYPGFDIKIVDPDFQQEQFQNNIDELPKNVIISLMENGSIRYYLFLINNILVIEAHKDYEFSSIKEWDIDNFFYIAKKVDGGVTRDDTEIQ
jgi:hypothetical protein